jgi:hypothetical protein
MNQLKKQLLYLAVLVNAAHLYGAETTTTNIVPRSQSFNAARQIVGWDNSIWGINRQCPDDRYYTSFNLTFEYTRTFRENGLTRCLFGDDLVCSGCDNDLGINVSSSFANASLANDGAPIIGTRNSKDWLGDYFGLPLDFQSTVNFNPQISNYLLDFSFYAGLDAWVDGLYFRIHSPFVHTTWNLNATETIRTTSNTLMERFRYLGVEYPAGYFSNENIAPGSTNTSFLAYANGETPSISAYGQEDIIWQPLCCSRMVNSCDCENDGGFSRNGFGEIRFVLGRNIFGDKEGRDCHLGLGIYAAAPTGTRVGSSRYLFEPIVGNGKHWELGGQVTAHHIFWKSEDEEKSIGMYLEANVTHLFGANQTRCFDLCSAGNNSRYMLAQRLQDFGNVIIAQLVQTTPPVTLAPRVDFPLLEFANEYAPVANLTRRDITSTIAAQGDMALSFAYKVGGFQWDLGYNFWGRSCEELRISTDCCPVIQGTWALKGNAYVYGFEPNYPVSVPLAATDSSATIHSGSANRFVSEIGVNLGVDNNVAAIDSAGFTLVGNPDGGSGSIIYTSNLPVLIDESDFNLSGTRGISNKIFTNFNYAWPDCNGSKWSPYAGLGAEVEFGSKQGPKCCDNPCDTSYCEPTPTACDTLRECCSNCALTQWGVWFKVGTSYN